jgi:hypothetical protein
MLDPAVERLFSLEDQRRRRQTAEVLMHKRALDVVITPAEKQYRGPKKTLGGPKKYRCSSQQPFRGSNYRGISRNGGSSWQILVMLN